MNKKAIPYKEKYICMLLSPYIVHGSSCVMQQKAKQEGVMNNEYYVSLRFITSNNFFVLYQGEKGKP